MKSKVSVELSRKFQKEFKRLLKKYPSVKSELAQLSETLQNQPKTGVPLGNNIYKIRFAIKSKGKGKSGGARIISYVETELIGLVENNIITLLSIYDKAEVSTLTKEEIQTLVEEIQQQKQ